MANKKLSVNNVKLTNTPSPDPDNLTIAGTQYLDEERAKIEVSRLQTELDNLKKSFNMSSNFAIAIFGFVFIWMTAVFCFLCYQSTLCPFLRLDKTILVTLLSTTTINVIGLLYIVIKFVFNHRLSIK